MSLTTTYLNGTITAGQNLITLSAYTAPTGANFLSQDVILQFVSGERCLVVDASLSPTLSVVRGYDQTTAAAHTNYEGVQYALANDAAWPTSTRQFGQSATISLQSQEITATGATGTTAGVVTPTSTAFLNVTGVSGTGINLPVPNVGQSYTIQNNGTGAISIYCVGGTINTTTGTTAFTLTATGNKMAFANCSTSGTWRIAGNT